MSQLFDFFVCSRPWIEKWATALGDGDEDLQRQIEAEMPRHVTFKNLGQNDFNILARCAEGEVVDTVKAVGEVDLVKEISEVGPWILAFRQPAIEAIAKMRVDKPLLQRWVNAMTKFHGGAEAQYRNILSAEAAKTLKDLCYLAFKEKAGVFTCYYG